MGDAVERRGPGAELLVETRGPVRLVTLNRPDALNATNEDLHRELAGVWPDIAADPDIGAVVLTGAGRGFCGGGDLNLLQRMTEDPDLRASTGRRSGSAAAWPV
jgi:enoyl-CoA hydratase